MIIPVTIVAIEVIRAVEVVRIVQIGIAVVIEVPPSAREAEVFVVNARFGGNV